MDRPDVRPVTLRKTKRAKTGRSRPAPATAEPIPIPELLKVRRVASSLDVSSKRVYTLIESGELEIVRLGPRQIRILASSFRRYVAGLIEDHPPE